MRWTCCKACKKAKTHVPQRHDSLIRSILLVSPIVSCARLSSGIAIGLRRGLSGQNRVLCDEFQIDQSRHHTFSGPSALPRVCRDTAARACREYPASVRRILVIPILNHLLSDCSQRAPQALASPDKRSQPGQGHMLPGPGFALMIAFEGGNRCRHRSRAPDGRSRISTS